MTWLLAQRGWSYRSKAGRSFLDICSAFSAPFHRFLRFALATFLFLYFLAILVKIFLFNTVDLNQNMVLAEKM